MKPANCCTCAKFVKPHLSLHYNALKLHQTHLTDWIRCIECIECIGTGIAVVVVVADAAVAVVVVADAADVAADVFVDARTKTRRCRYRLNAKYQPNEHHDIR